MSTSVSGRRFRSYWIPILLLLIFGAAQTPWCLSIALRMAMRASQVEFTHESLHGFWMHVFEVHGIEYSTGGFRIRVDTVRVYPSVPHLLIGRLRVKRVELLTPQIQLQSTPSGNHTASTNQETGYAADFLWIDSIAVHRGSFQMEGTAIQVSGIQLRGGLSPVGVQVDTLYGDLTGYQQMFRLTARASLWPDQNLLQLDTLLLTDSRSTLQVRGYAGRETDLYAHALLHSGVLSPEIDSVFAITAGIQGKADSLYFVLDGESTQGGAVKMRGSFQNLTPSVYLDTLEFENLDVAYLIPNLSGNLNGMIHGHIQGASLDSLRGRVKMHLRGGTLAEIPIQSALLTGEIEQGDIQVQLRSDMTLGSVDMSGSLYPSQGAGQLSGQFKNFNTKAISARHQSSLHGNFSIEWADSLEAYVRIRRGRLGQINMIDGEVHISNRGDEVEMTAVLHADSARVAWNANLLESGITGRLAMQDMDVEALMNQKDALSRVNLEAEFTSNWPPDSILLRVDVQPSSWQNISVQEGDAKVLLHGLDLNVYGYVELPSGNASVWGDINFDTKHPVWRLRQSRVNGLNLQDLGMNADTDLNIQMQLSGSGLTRASGQFIVEPSRMNHELISSGTISVSLSDSEALVEGRLEIGEGSIQSSAKIQGLHAQPAVYLTEGVFEQINLAALTGLDSLSTYLTGRIDSLEWERGNHGYASVHIDSGAVRAVPVQGGHLHIQTLGDTLTAEGAIELDQGYLQVNRMQIEAGPKILAQGVVHNLPLNDLGVGDADLNGTFDVNLTGNRLETATLHHAHIHADRTRIGKIQFDRLRISGTMEEGIVQLHEFDMVGNAGHLRAEGKVSLFRDAPDTLYFQGSITDASRLGWTGTAVADSLWGRLTHHEDSLRWAFGITAGPVTWKNIRLFSGVGYAQGTLHQFKPRIAKTEMMLERLSVPNLSARSAWVALSRRQGNMQFEAGLDVDDQRSLHIEGEADPTAHRGTLRKLDVSLGGEEWRLGVPTEILADQGVRIQYFLLESPGQEITLDGILNREGEQRMGLSLYNVQISSFTDLLGMPLLGGIANADLFFHGPAASPELTGSINLMVDSDRESVGSVTAKMKYAAGGMDMQADFVHTDGSTLSVNGIIPLDLRLKKETEIMLPDASMTLWANRFNLAWMSPFLVQDEIVGITGSRMQPHLRGYIHVSDGYARLPQLGITPRRFTMHLAMSRDTVYVEHMKASSGQGTAEARGYISAAEPDRGEMRIGVDLEDFRVVHTAPYVADVSGSLALGGTLRNPDITGHIEMTNAVIRPQDVPVTLGNGTIHFTETDIQMLEKYFNIRAGMRDTTTYSLVDALAMDLSVGIPGTVRLHSLQNPEMNVLLSGSIALNKAPYAEQMLRGTVSIVPEFSYLRQFGRRFDIRQGRVTFAGSATNPFFDLQAALDIPNQSGQNTPVTILLDASGRLQEPGSLSFALRSEPVQLDRADIISYMATGRPAADAFQLAGGGAIQSGGNLALQQLSSLVAGAAGAGLGLDLIQINPETGGGITFTAGKYVSRRLFASVKWPITEEPNTTSRSAEDRRELVIEYALYPWLVARMRGESQAMGLSLFYQYTW